MLEAIEDAFFVEDYASHARRARRIPADRRSTTNESAEAPYSHRSISGYGEHYNDERAHLA